MNTEKIILAIGNIDDSFITESQDYRKKDTKRRFIPAVLAACLLLCVAMAITMPQKNAWEPPNETTPQNNLSYAFEFEELAQGTTQSEAGYVTRLHAAVLHERFSTYTSSYVVTDTALIGEKLADVNVKNFWQDNIGGKQTDIISTTAEIYRLNGIDENTAVCLRYTGDTHYSKDYYYTFINTKIEAENLDEWNGKLGVTDKLNVSRISIIDTLSAMTDSFELDSANIDTLIKKIARIDGKAIRVTEDTKKDIFKDCRQKAEVYFTLRYSKSAFGKAVIADNGKLLYGFNGSSYLFEIDEGAAKEIIEYIFNNGEAVQTTSSRTETYETTRVNLKSA